MDAGPGLVRKARLTSATIYESEVADGLVMGDEEAVYAGEVYCRAYESKKRRQWPQSLGIEDRTMGRSHKHQSGLA